MIDLARRGEPAQEDRARAGDRREQARMLVELAEHLHPADRAVIYSIYDRGLSAAELARASNLQPAVMRRRVRRLVRRITSPLYRYVLRNSEIWPKRRWLVAREIFLRGSGQRETAAALGMSVHEVRQHAHFVQSAFEQASHEQEFRA